VAHATVSRACVRCLRLNWRRPTAFPSSASSGHPLSPARSFTAEEAAMPVASRPRFFVPTTSREERRHPENRDAFHRHDTRRKHAKRLLSPALAPALPLTPPTLFPQPGESAWKGIASVTVRSPAIRDGPSADGSGVQTPLLLSAIRAWD